MRNLVLATAFQALTLLGNLAHGEGFLNCVNDKLNPRLLEFRCEFSSLGFVSALYKAQDECTEALLSEMRPIRNVDMQFAAQIVLKTQARSILVRKANEQLILCGIRGNFSYDGENAKLYVVR